MDWAPYLKFLPSCMHRLIKMLLRRQLVELESVTATIKYLDGVDAIGQMNTFLQLFRAAHNNNRSEDLAVAVGGVPLAGDITPHRADVYHMMNCTVRVSRRCNPVYMLLRDMAFVVAFFRGHECSQERDGVMTAVNLATLALMAVDNCEQYTNHLFLSVYRFITTMLNLPTDMVKEFSVAVPTWPTVFSTREAALARLDDLVQESGSPILSIASSSDNDDDATVVSGFSV